MKSHFLPDFRMDQLHQLLAIVHPDTATLEQQMESKVLFLIRIYVSILLASDKAHAIRFFHL